MIESLFLIEMERDDFLYAIKFANRPRSGENCWPAVPALVIAACLSQLRQKRVAARCEFFNGWETANRCREMKHICRCGQRKIHVYNSCSVHNPGRVKRRVGRLWRGTERPDFERDLAEFGGKETPSSPVIYSQGQARVSAIILVYR
jgi:hypothetical protein